MIKTAILFIIGYYKRNFSCLVNHGFNGCRFYPSCSDYATEAIVKKGLARGGLMAVGRVLRCNPLSRGGVDYVDDGHK